MNFLLCGCLPFAKKINHLVYDVNHIVEDELMINDSVNCLFAVYKLSCMNLVEIVCKMIDVVYKDIISANKCLHVVELHTTCLQSDWMLFALFTKWKGCLHVAEIVRCDWCCLQRIILVDIVYILFAKWLMLLIGCWDC